MSISTRVGDYLTAEKIHFDTINHAHSNSSVGSAIATQIPSSRIAKAVVLEDHEGRHLMAVLPANRRIRLHRLQDQLASSLHLVQEETLSQMFTDCQQGAVPAFAKAYNMNAIYDDVLEQLGDIYFEAGDHETLIHLTQEQFGKLMSNTQHAQFSVERMNQWSH